MMQELSAGFRQSGLHIFRHRKGMLFVSPVRPRPFGHEVSSVSPSIARIVTALKETAGMNRKQLLDKLQPENDNQAEVREKAKRVIVSDLHWLISEGHVIEFNDGALDLPRAKPTPPPPSDTSNGTAKTVMAPDEPETHTPPTAPTSLEGSVEPTPLTELPSENHSDVTPPPESVKSS
jgi:hypothetical protein